MQSKAQEEETRLQPYRYAMSAYVQSKQLVWSNKNAKHERNQHICMGTQCQLGYKTKLL